jgi:hypothetical protein
MKYSHRNIVSHELFLVTNEYKRRPQIQIHKSSKSTQIKSTPVFNQAISHASFAHLNQTTQSNSSSKQLFQTQTKSKTTTMSNTYLYKKLPTFNPDYYHSWASDVQSTFAERNWTAFLDVTDDTIDDTKVESTMLTYQSGKARKWMF